MPQPYFTVEMKENTDLNPGQVSTSSSSSRAPEPVMSVETSQIKRKKLGPASWKGLAS